MKNCVDVSANIRKNIFVCEKIYIWNLSTCTCENGKYLESIIGDSEITCDEIIEATKPFEQKKFDRNRSNKKYKFSCFTHFFINYHAVIDNCYIV